MPKVPIFAKDAHILVPKNVTSGAQTKILRPLPLPLVLSVYPFWMGFKPIFVYCQMFTIFGPFSISTDPYTKTGI